MLASYLMLRCRRTRPSTPTAVTQRAAVNPKQDGGRQGASALGAETMGIDNSGRTGRRVRDSGSVWVQVGESRKVGTGHSVRRGRNSTRASCFAQIPHRRPSPCFGAVSSHLPLVFRTSLGRRPHLQARPLTLSCHLRPCRLSSSRDDNSRWSL